MRMLVIAPAMVLFVSCAAIAEPQSIETDREQVRNAALRVRGAIVDHDIAVLLSFIPRQGMLCTDDVIDRETVAVDLADSSSDLHRRLFGPEIEGRTPDLGGWFRTHPEVNPRVDFIAVEGRVNQDWACVRFAVEKHDDEGHEFCFYRMEGKWMLTNSLYECE